MAEECVFCNIIEKKEPADIVHEDEEVIAFKNINPAAETHFLIVPKKHVENFMELNADSPTIQKITKVVQLLIDNNELETGYKVLFNGGRYQAIQHIHCHLLGGKMNNKALQET